jgi:hypothetical protein
VREGRKEERGALNADFVLHKLEEQDDGDGEAKVIALAQFIRREGGWPIAVVLGHDLDLHKGRPEED